MDGDKMIFILVITAIMTSAWLINNWIRARHGYALEDEWGGKTEKPQKTDLVENERLKAENRELNEKLDSMQDRMIVLEKIVTDRGYSLADEIEALRDVPVKNEAGVPLNIDTKENQS